MGKNTTKRKDTENKTPSDWHRLKNFGSADLYGWTDEDGWALKSGMNLPAMEAAWNTALEHQRVPETDWSGITPSVPTLMQIQKTSKYKATPYFMAYWMNKMLTEIENRFWSYLQDVEKDTRKADKQFAAFCTDFRARFP